MVIGQQMKEEEDEQTYYLILPFSFDSFLLKITSDYLGSRIYK